MTLGNKIFLLIFCISLSNFSIADQKITTSPLINVDNIKPSFENLEDKKENILSTKKLKERTKDNDLKSSQAIIIGLDKITAKTSKFIVNLNENKKYGPLEIKVLKCGKVKVNNKIDSIAYLQVKDLTKSRDKQVFIFNGWTFASDPSLTPFDHAIYDLHLKDCKSI